MLYTTSNNKVIKIPDNEIEKLMKLDLTKDEAIELWLDDNNYSINEEQEKLDNKAKQVRIDHDAQEKEEKRKPYVRKVSAEKVSLFIELMDWVEDLCEENNFKFKVLKDNKLIIIEMANGKQFKIDLVEVSKKKQMEL